MKQLLTKNAAMKWLALYMCAIMMFSCSEDPDPTEPAIIEEIKEPDNKDDDPLAEKDTTGQNVLLYGFASEGGEHKGGTAFRLNGNGTDFEIIHQFSTLDEFGTHPKGAFNRDSKNFLHGTTTRGGAHDSGTSFFFYFDMRHQYDIGKSRFAGESHEALGAVLLTAWSYTYGQTSEAIYTVYPFKIVKELDHETGYGGSSGLMQPTKAFTLLGVTPKGGEFGNGTIFQIGDFLHDFEKLLSFNLNNGGKPSKISGLIYAYKSTEKYYGLISNVDGDGKISFFKYDYNTNTIEFFPSDFPESYLSPYSNGMVMVDQNTMIGLLMGDGVNSNGLIYTYNLTNDTVTVVYEFDKEDGIMPLGTLIGKYGVFYGTTSKGTAEFPYSTVFRYDYQNKEFKVIKKLDPETEGIGSIGALHTWPF